MAAMNFQKEHLAICKLPTPPIVKKNHLITTSNFRIMKTFFKPTITFNFLFSITLTICGQASFGVTFNNVHSKAIPNSRIFGTTNGSLGYEFGFMSENTNKAIGVSLYKTFTKLFLMTDVTYRDISTKYMVRDYLEEVNPNVNYISESHKLIHVPVIAGINFKNIKVGAGSIFNIHIENDNALSKAYPFVNQGRKLDTGMTLFAGYKLFNRALIQVRYEKSFVRVGNHIYYNQQSTRIQSFMDNLTFGISIYPAGMD